MGKYMINKTYFQKYLVSFRKFVLSVFLCCFFFNCMMYAQNLSDLAMRARINLYETWNFDSCASYFDKIIGNKKAPAFAYSDYGWYLMLIDQFDSGLKYVGQAAKMAPADVQLICWYAWALLWAGDLRSAQMWIEKALLINFENGEALHVASRIASEKGDHVEAIKLAEHAAKDPSWRGVLPLVLVKAGRKEQALEEVKAMLGDESVFDTWFLAEVYTALGDDSQALGYLQKAFEMRFPFMPWLELVPGLKKLKNYPTFQNIVQKMKLP